MFKSKSVLKHSFLHFEWNKITHGKEGQKYWRNETRMMDQNWHFL